MRNSDCQRAKIGGRKKNVGERLLMINSDSERDGV